MKNLLNTTLASGLMLLLFFGVTNGQNIYVNHANSGGTEDGDSWATAYTSLTDALSDIRLGTSVFDVWVAQGTYTTGGIDRSASFNMVNNVSLFGGFDGTESTEEQRDISGNPTVLSGDIGVPDDNSDNNYHVVVATDVSGLIDGFIIKNGNANAGGGPNNTDGMGGGVLIVARDIFGSYTVRNCFIQNNRADFGGGIAHVAGLHDPFADDPFINANSNIINTIISGNVAISDGGGIYNGTLGYNAISTSAYINCTIADNTAGQGGGVVSGYFFEEPPSGGETEIFSNANFGNSVFSNNVAGGIPQSASSMSVGVCNFLNCIFPDNPFTAGSISNSIIDTDPLLNSNFVPSSSSLAIDAGDNLLLDGLGIDKDLSGKSRILDGTVDMGAIEFSSAKLVINEFKTNRPDQCDLVELRAIKAGEITGMQLYQRNTLALTFDNFQVATDDIIVVHWNKDDAGCNPNESGNEKTSTDQFPNTTYSANYDAAFDWYVSDNNIVQTDIVLTLTDATGAIIDAVLASDNPSGTAAAASESQAVIVAAAGEWTATDGTIPAGGFVDDNFNAYAAQDLNAAESIQRNSNSDYNHKGDWTGNIPTTWGILNSGQTVVDSDVTAPTPVISTEEANPVFKSAFDIKIAFNEQVFDFTSSDLVLDNATLSDFKDNLDNTFTATINPSSEGSVEVDLPASRLTDLAGNPNAAASQFGIVYIINVPPTITLGSDVEINEDAGSQSLSNWASDITDGNAGVEQAITIEISTNNNSLFSSLPVITTDGVLEFTSALDKNGIATVSVTMKDDGPSDAPNDNTADAVTFNITVKAVNDPPTITLGSDIEVNEDVGAQDFTSWASNIDDGDSDASQTLDIELTPDNSSLFDGGLSINTDGRLQFTPAANAHGTATITVAITDNGNSTPPNDNKADNQTFKIKINPINDKPVISNGQALEVAEDNPLTIALNALTVIDPDNTYPEDFTLTVQGGSNYNFSGQTITPAENFSGALTVPVTVNDGQLSSDPHELTVTVTPLNDKPVITSSNTLETNEDQPKEITLAAVDVTDPDNNFPDDFTLSVHSGSNYTVTGNTITPNLNYHGPLTIPVTVTDGDLTSDAHNLTMTVSPINDKPEITNGQNLEVAEDTNLEIPLSSLTVSDPDDTYPSDFTLLVENGENYTLNGQSILPSLNYNGTLSVPVRVNDGEVSSDSYTMSITVTLVNDKPSVTNYTGVATATEDGSINIESDKFEVSDPDNSASEITIALSEGENYIFSGNTVTPNPNFFGNLSVKAKANDGQIDSEAFEFTVIVASVNDEPGFTLQETSVTLEEDFNQPHKIALNAEIPVFGESSEAITYTINQPESEFINAQIDPGTGEITLSAEENGFGSFSYTITANDGQSSNNLFTANLEVTVSGVNDAPILENISDIVILVGETLSVAASASDVENHGIQYSLSSDATSLGMSIDPTSGKISWQPSNDHVGTHSIKVIATDDAETPKSSETPFDVIVQPQGAPEVNAGISDQEAKEDQPFILTIPNTAFSDDGGVENLTYTTELTDGTKLEMSWLEFNGTVFTGLPLVIHIGEIEVKVTATDKDGNFNFTTFKITVESTNDAPKVIGSIAAQTAFANTAFSITIDKASVFSDEEQNASELALTASLANGEALPSWLSLVDEALSGTPTSELVGTSYELMITAKDDADQGISTSFKLMVDNEFVEGQPKLNGEVKDQTATEDEQYSLTIAPDLFTDDGSITYSVQQQADELPAWLAFDPSSRLLSGTPKHNDHAGVYKMKVTATDKDGKSASTFFQLAVEAVNDAPILTRQLEDQVVEQDAPFSLTLPSDLFSDEEDSELAIAVSLDDGSELPIWLKYQDGVFTGTPGEADLGEITVWLTATDDGGLSVNTTFSVTINPVTSLYNDVVKMLEVYPNPSTGIFEIEVGAAIDEVRITVTSIDGKVVSERRLTTNEGLQHHLDISREKPGIYLLQIITEESTATLKLIKQ